MTTPDPRRLVAATVGLVLVAGLALAACGSVAPPSLAGRTFLSTAVTLGGADRPLVPDSRIRLVFSEDGQLGASAGCNQIGGTYRIDGDRLVVGGSSMTEMGCDPARHEQDEWLVAFLSSGPLVALSGTDLALTSGDTVVHLLDRVVAEPDLPLTGRTWTVVSIVRGDTVSSVPAGVTAGLEFRPDGTTALRTGCNDGGGRYSVDGDRIRFEEIVTTDVACPGPAGEMERAVLDLLAAETITFEVEASQLTLRGGAVGLGLASG